MAVTFPGYLHFYYVPAMSDGHIVFTLSVCVYVCAMGVCYQNRVLSITLLFHDGF